MIAAWYVHIYGVRAHRGHGVKGLLYGMGYSGVTADVISVFGDFGSGDFNLKNSLTVISIRHGNAFGFNDVTTHS